MPGRTEQVLPLPRFVDPVKALLVVAPYYWEIADLLISGARAVLDKVGASHTVVEVPGALEIPAAVAQAFRMAEFDAFVALGCVVRGETSHYDIVAGESARGLMLLSLQGACIGNGILTVDTLEQARLRADPAGQDKGGHAAAAALHLLALAQRWGRPKGTVGFRPSGAGLTGHRSGEGV